MSDDRVESRAEHLLPEEEAVGSDDPTAQAEVILEESDERMEEAVQGDPEGDDQIRRKSEETAVEPE